MTIYINLARHQQSVAAYNALFCSYSTRVVLLVPCGIYTYRHLFYNYLLISMKICENLLCILRKNFVAASYMYLKISSILFNRER